MSDFVRHFVIGNDTPPWLVAVTRALIFGSLLGLGALVTAWQSGESGEDLAKAFVGALMAYVILRAGVEGYIDQRKNGGPKP